jgi:hypothetical protein
VFTVRALGATSAGQMVDVVRIGPHAVSGRQTFARRLLPPLHVGRDPVHGRDERLGRAAPGADGDLGRVGIGHAGYLRTS